MDHPTGDPGAQFVLDNRKLIVGFALLIVLCGTFFVIGFMEGKRQGIQRAGAASPAEPRGVPPVVSIQGPAKEGVAGSEPTPLAEKSVREQLEWYKSVNKKEETTPVEPAAAGKKEPVPTRSAAPPAAPAVKPHETGKAQAASRQKVTYSVQVGAFRQRHEAETQAASLKERGYNSTIEPSGSSQPLFLLKVGKFESRADAVAMQLRLKKDGFSTIIKTNQ